MKEKENPANVTDKSVPKVARYLSCFYLIHLLPRLVFQAGWSEIMLILVSSGGKPCSAAQHNRSGGGDNANAVGGRRRGLISGQLGESFCKWPCVTMQSPTHSDMLIRSRLPAEC